MVDFSMPTEIREAIKGLASSDHRCFKVSRESSTSIAILFDVADHPEPDCKFVSQILFDWDIPEPGQLLAYASLGIWNPPAPEDGIHVTPFIDIGPSDEKAYPPMVLRHLAVPSEIASLAKPDIDNFVAQLIESIQAFNPNFGQNLFDDTKRPKRLVSNAFSGLIESKGKYLQWRDWLDQERVTG